MSRFWEEGDCSGGFCERNQGLPCQTQPIPASSEMDSLVAKAAQCWWHLCENIFKGKKFRGLAVRGK